MALQRSLILAVKVAVATGLVAWLALSDRLHLSRLASIRLGWPLLALFALVAGSMIIPAIRWWWLLRIQGLNEPLGKIFRLTWAGYLAALILPGAASGDLAKSYLILRDNSQARARALSTVLADRFLGLYSLSCLGAFAVIGVARSQWTLSHGVGMMAGATLLLIFMMTVGLAGLLSHSTRTVCFRILPIAWRVAWNESFGMYRGQLPQLCGCFGLSLISSLTTTASFSVAGGLLGLTITLDSAFLAGPLIVIANCLPFTPGGIGLAEAVSSELYSYLGSSEGAEMMALTRICTLLVALPGLFSLMPSHD